MKKYIYILTAISFSMLSGCAGSGSLTSETSLEIETETSSGAKTSTEAETEFSSDSESESEQTAKAEPVGNKLEDDTWLRVEEGGDSVVYTDMFADGVNLSLKIIVEDGKKVVTDAYGNKLWDGYEVEEAYILFHEKYFYWAVEGYEEDGSRITRVLKINQNFESEDKTELIGFLDMSGKEIKTTYESVVGISVSDTISYEDFSVTHSTDESFTASAAFLVSTTRELAFEGVYDCLILEGSEIVTSVIKKYGTGETIIKIYSGGTEGWISLNHLKTIDKNQVQDERIAYFNGFSNDKYELVNAHLSMPDVKDAKTRVKTWYKCCEGVLQVGERQMAVVQYLEPVIEDEKCVLQYNCFLYAVKEGKLELVKVDGYNLNGNHIPVRLLAQTEALTDTYTSGEYTEVLGIKDETITAFSNSQTIMIDGEEYGFESDTHLARISSEGGFEASDEKSAEDLDDSELQNLLKRRLNLYKNRSLFDFSYRHAKDITEAVELKAFYKGKPDEEGAMVYAALYTTDQGDKTGDNEEWTLALYDSKTLDLLAQESYHGNPVQVASYEKSDKIPLVLLVVFRLSHEGNYQEQFLMDFSEGTIKWTDPLKNYEEIDDSMEIYCNIAQDGTLEIYEFPDEQSDPDKLDSEHLKCIMMFDEETGEFVIKD